MWRYCGGVAVFIPIGGEYYYVGVVHTAADEAYVDECARGIRGDYVERVLASKAVGFKQAGQWHREPLSGDDLQMVMEARQAYRAKLTSAASTN